MKWNNSKKKKAKGQDIWKAFAFLCEDTFLASLCLMGQLFLFPRIILCLCACMWYRRWSSTLKYVQNRKNQPDLGTERSFKEWNVLIACKAQGTFYHSNLSTRKKERKALLSTKFSIKNLGITGFGDMVVYLIAYRIAPDVFSFSSLVCLNYNHTVFLTITDGGLL